MLTDRVEYQRMLHEAWNDYENATIDIHDLMYVAVSIPINDSYFSFRLSLFWCLYDSLNYIIIEQAQRTIASMARNFFQCPVLRNIRKGVYRRKSQWDLKHIRNKKLFTRLDDFLIKISILVCC